MDFLSILLVVVLVCFSGMFSGLTLGLMGLDVNELKVKVEAGSEDEKKYASKIIPVRNSGNLLLCTLLLGNVAVNAALSIVMADMISSLVGFFASTALITIFGEIAPQAYCSRNPLAIGAATIPIVKVIRALLFIITYPISKLLDRLLGEDMGQYYTKDEFVQLIAMNKGKLRIDEVEANIMSGVMDLSRKTVMTPLEDTFMLEVHRRLDFQVMSDIFKSGYSRVPLYDKKTPHNSIVGLLFTKDLVLIDPADRIPIRSILQTYGRQPVHVWPEDSLRDVLQKFKTGKSHMAVVRETHSTGMSDPYYVNVGIVTLEDIIEEILQDEIVDETDIFVDVAKGTKVRREAFDMRQLSLFDTRRRPPANRVPPQEAHAVFLFLRASQPLFMKKHGCVLPSEAIKELIANAELLEVVPKVDTQDGEEVFDTAEVKKVAFHPGSVHQWQSVDEGGRWLYVRNQPSEHFCLVLDGDVRVNVGEDGFVCNLSRWSVLGAKTLQELTPEVVTACGVRRRRRSVEKAKMELEDTLPTPVSSAPPSPHSEERKSSYRQRIMELEEQKQKPEEEFNLPPFLPDFSARAISNCRVLRISRQQWAAALHKVLFPKQGQPEQREEEAKPAPEESVPHSDPRSEHKEEGVELVVFPQPNTAETAMALPHMEE